MLLLLLLLQFLRLENLSCIRTLHLDRVNFTKEVANVYLSACIYVLSVSCL